MPGVEEQGGPLAGRLATAAADGTASPRALFERWFDPCVDVAYRILQDRDEAADVAQQTFLGVRPGSGGRRGSSSFGRWALGTTRDEALNRLARRRRSSPPGGPPEPGNGTEGDAAEGARVAWAAFAALGASDASVLDLHLRHGFAVDDVAEALGVSANEAHQLLFRLKRRLGAAVRAWSLWPPAPPGQPGCTELRSAIQASELSTFGSHAVQVIGQHARSCRDCQGRQRLSGSPEALFAAAPAMPAGPVLTDRAIAVLAAAGMSVGPGPAGAGAAGPNGTPTPLSPGGDASAPTTGPTPAIGHGDPPDGPTTGPTPVVGPATAGDPTTGPTPAIGHGDPPGGPTTGPTAAVGPATAGDPTTGPTAAVGHGPPPGDPTTGPTPVIGHGDPAGGGPAHRLGTHRLASGERPPAQPYTYRPSYGHRRRVAGIGLAVVLVLVMSLAVVGFTRGDDGSSTVGSDDATTTTSLPAGDSTAPTGGAPSTEPGGQGPAPTAVPPPTDRPGGAPGPQDPSDAELPAPPEIMAFGPVDQALGTPCGADERRITLAWESVEGTSARLDGPGVPTDVLAPSGRAQVCRDPGPPATYTLTVTGPGGTTFRTTNV